MIASGQKPPPRGADVGRPRTGQTPVQYIRVPDNDWNDLRAVAGRRAHATIREFIRWYLRRPGAKLPERPGRDHIDECIADAELGDGTTA